MVCVRVDRLRMGFGAGRLLQGRVNLSGVRICDVRGVVACCFVMVANNRGWRVRRTEPWRHEYILPGRET